MLALVAVGGIEIRMKILIIEDEAKIGEALKNGLKAENFDVTWTATGEEGFFSALSSRYDLILLDLNLPGRSGIEVLSTLRGQGHQTPVLILTARDTIEDRVLGLETGADDYLVKPFAFPELVARIKAILRRGRSQPVTTLNVGDLKMDLMARSVTRAEKPLDLTVREFELLEYFLKNQNQMVSREMLARDVWKEPNRATSLDNVIDVHIARLRRKVDQDFENKLIHTVRGVGFVLKEDG
jgi:two-component system, OmpR family, copper resistance phosphate regulon response regulator CusR